MAMAATLYILYCIYAYVNTRISLCYLGMARAWGCDG